MTTVVGIQGNGFAVLAADSQITEDNLRTISLGTPKIVQVGYVAIGITGDTRAGDILTYNWKPPTYRGEDPVQFMGKKMIPSIINAFNKNTYDWANVDKKDGGFDYLIAFDSNLFHIACDMSFIQNELKVYGIGSGGQFATGYLYSLNYKSMTQDKAVEIAQKAVEISAQLDINTCPPIQIAIQKRKGK